jgi:hypothetical protein
MDLEEAISGEVIGAIPPGRDEAVPSISLQNRVKANCSRFK